MLLRDLVHHLVQPDLVHAGRHHLNTETVLLQAADDRANVRVTNVKRAHRVFARLEHIFETGQRLTIQHPGFPDDFTGLVSKLLYESAPTTLRIDVLVKPSNILFPDDAKVIGHIALWNSYRLGDLAYVEPLEIEAVYPLPKHLGLLRPRQL